MKSTQRSVVTPRVNRAFLAALALLPFAPFAVAQETAASLPDAGTSKAAPAAPANGPAAEDEATVLTEVNVEGAATDEGILAVRPSRSLYGFEETLAQTPRSVFQISKAQLENDNIRNFSDFSRYSPSIRRGTTTTYGIAGIRGSMGDTARNGTILINTALRPFDANAWESVDIVAGVPSVSQGSTARTSGYVNYITKKPYFDGPHTTITTTIGRLGLDNDSTYPQYSVQLDHSLVLIEDKLAARFSVQRSEAEQYWKGSDADFKDIYASVTWKPADRLTIDANFSYTASAGALPWGINRIDQELIDNWTYKGGDYVPGITTAGGSRYIYNPALNGGAGGWFQTNNSWSNANKDTLAYALGTAPWEVWTDANGDGIQDNVGTLTFRPPSEGQTREPIDGSQVIAGRRGANNQARQYIAQGIATLEIDEHYSVVSRSTYQFVDNENRNYDYMFSEHPNRVFEQRLEFQTDHEIELFGVPVRHQSNSGGSYRFLLNYCDSAVSSTYGSDLSTWANALNPESLDLSYRLSSALKQLSPDDLVGLHPDHVGGAGFVDSANALKAILASGYGYLWWEPSWHDGDWVRSLSIGGGRNDGYGLAEALYYSDRRSNYLHYYSLFTEHKFDIGKLFTWRAAGRLSYIYDTIYITPLTKRLLESGYFAGSPYENIPHKSHQSQTNGQFNTSLSFHPVRWLNVYATYDRTESIAGCGCCEADGWSSGYHLDPNKFAVPSELYEAGAKFDVIPGRLYASAAVFRQTRASISTNFNTGAINTNHDLYQGAEFAVTWTPAARFAIGGNYSYIHASREEAGTRLNGTPLNTGNLWATYQFPNGLGVKGNFWISSEWNVSSSVTVPVQYGLDLGVFYTYKNWRVDVDVMNVTDEKNWSPANANGGDTYSYLLPMERFGAQAKVTYAF